MDEFENPDATPRETLEPSILRTEISVALQMMRGTRTARDNLAREAFQAIAGFLVEYFDQRGYVVTAPKRTHTMHSWPPPPRNPHLRE